ncbi:MAG TPA: deoxyribodipyrimidine photo-lyase, partial [Shinella sp.]|nr:deoxyribodipyrimidine photo-lyase [Shinella sp.]
MATNPAPVIVWFRKDLRTDDNAALAAAAETGRAILPLYILEPVEAGTGPLGAAQRWWLHHALAALAKSLSGLGAPLVLRAGPADAALDAVIAESGADTIHWNRRHDPPGMAIDRAIKAALKARGLVATSFAGQLLHDPTRLLTGEKKPFRVYTPFWKALERAGDPSEPIDPPARLAGFPGPVASDRLEDWHLAPEKPDWAAPFHAVWTPGEAAARERLETFVDGALDGYAVDRDRPA